ncbi:hypothetical protein TNCT_142151 [Trichonephila clavata]|uniref:Uncharacterized protein n=1 Tax=Trichonephila clavata TaxID=2740835 RepID=A0A8X6L8G2_TRICU|nr:hypothetical protein TNCT_142151 [Trichonephila clavata]
MISDFQHCFRKETSTYHQLLGTANKIIYGFNHSKTAGGLFLDVEKTLNRLWHNGLICQIINLSYPPYPIHTIADYFNERTFQIKVLEHFKSLAGRAKLASYTHIGFLRCGEFTVVVVPTIE